MASRTSNLNSCNRPTKEGFVTRNFGKFFGTALALVTVASVVFGLGTHYHVLTETNKFDILCGLAIVQIGVIAGTALSEAQKKIGDVAERSMATSNQVESQPVQNLKGRATIASPYQTYDGHLTASNARRREKS